MDAVDIRDMVEQAKADVSATRALRKGPNEGLDSLLDEVGNVPPAGTTESLASEIDEMVEQAKEEEKVAAANLLERGRHVKIAKLLATLDVISEVRS